MGTKCENGEILFVALLNFKLDGLNHGESECDDVGESAEEPMDDEVEDTETYDNALDELQNTSCRKWCNLRPPIVSSGNHNL